MFVRDADKRCLRQGDILERVPYPLLASAEMSVLGRFVKPTQPSGVPDITAVTRVHRDDPNWLVAQLPIRLSFVAVISQCCDLEPRHGKLLMPAFSVARLIPIPKAITEDPQRLVSLRSNKDPRDPRDPGYLNFFYIPQSAQLNGNEWIVDYNQVVAIPGREYPGILTSKILQMEGEWRVKFKIKLAACLTRLTQDEINAGLENPWVSKQKPIDFPQ